MKLLTKFNKIIPKKSNRIVLLSNLGFRDNVKAFYDHLVENNYQEKYDIICVSNDYYELEKLPNIKYVGIKEGLYYYLTSKFCFYCFGKYPAKPTKEQIVVNFGHGMPIKTNGNLKKGFENVDYNYFTKVLSTSPFFSSIIKGVFGARDNQILIASNPRNDFLFKPKFLDDATKRLLWMPTFRSEGKGNEGGDTLIFSMKKKEWTNLNEYLKKRMTLLYIKPHPLEKSKINIKEQYSNIKLIDDRQLSRRNCPLYSFIGGMDGLITDYSSVYYDYLLLNRPVLFINDDFEDYGKNRGIILENQKKYMIGDFTTNIDGIKKFIDDIVNTNDAYRVEREKINDLFNTVKKNICDDICKQVGLKK